MRERKTMQTQARQISLRAIITLGIVLLISLTTACGTSGPSGSATPTSSAPTPSPTASIDRHGLPDNVPLPNGVTFKSKNVYVPFSTGPVHLSNFSADCISIPTNNTWVWTVPSPSGPTQTQQFYQTNLPAKGWTSTRTHAACKGGNPVISGCQGTNTSQILLVEIGSTITLTDEQGHPTSTIVVLNGGTALAIALVPNEPGKTDPTLGIYIPSL